MLRLGFFVTLGLMFSFGTAQAQGLMPQPKQPATDDMTQDSAALGSMRGGPKCATIPAPKVQIELLQTPEMVNDRLLMPEIALIAMRANGHGVNSKHSDELPAGLSVADFSILVDYRTSATEFPRRGACAQISDFTLKIGFKDSAIYVARELPRRSCPYKQVLAHERKHKAVDEALLQEYTGIFEQAAADIVKAIGQVRARNRSDAERRIGDEIDKHVKKLSEAFAQERANRQADVDSDDEYRRVTFSCEGRLLDILAYRYGEDWKTTLRDKVALLAKEGK